MQEGQTIEDDGEKITCVKSATSGGPFIFEMELAPGKAGPPDHTHDEGDEIIEVLDGEIVFRIRGDEKLLRTGERLKLTPNDPHTFWNPSKTTTVRCRVTHGGRFEQAMSQLSAGGPTFTRLAMFLTYQDPGASRMASPFVRGVLGLVAAVGKLRGVKTVLNQRSAG